MASRAEYNRKWRAKNRAAYNAQRREAYRKDPEKPRAVSRNRAREIASDPVRHDAYLARMRKYRLEHRSEGMIRRTKKNAELRGLEHTITEADLLPLPLVCPVLGVVLNYEPRGAMSMWSPSVDRIDNTKGYVPGNVVIISMRANRLKSDATINELVLLAEYFSSVEANK